MRNANMIAAAVLAMIAGTDPARGTMTSTVRTTGEGRQPTPPRRDTAKAREIAEWNEAVERRKAEKKARKLSAEFARPNVTYKAGSEAKGSR